VIAGPTVITGAGRGIGRSIALRVAADGGPIGLWGRDRERLESLAAGLVSTTTTHVQVVDVSVEEEVMEAARATAEALGGIRCVVNNAGIAHPGPFDELSVADWDRLFAVNTRGVMLVTKATLPYVRQHSSGVYVNLVSEVGRLNQAGNVAYGASKAAVVSFTQGLGLELAPEGVRVNAVAPGPVETDMWDNAVRSRSAAEGISAEEFRRRVLAKIPGGRFPSVDDVAEAVAFLLDDRTGGSIVADCLFVTNGSTVY